MVVTLAYYNSLYTQMSQGELSIKVISWHFNGTAFPDNYYVQLKVGSDQRSCKRLYSALTFKTPTTNPLLENLTILVSQDKAMARDPLIT